MTTIVNVIASELCLNSEYLQRIANRSDYYYKTYFINKKNGGKRQISQPSPELKTLQYWVVHNIINHLPTSTAAKAYMKGSSTYKNAQPHLQSKYLFHTDIVNFFANTHPELLFDVIQKNSDCINKFEVDLNKSLKEIEKICFFKNGLSIGAVSSPSISNAVLFDFDNYMVNYCNEHEFTYTRYADDIYVSSNSYINKSIIEYIQDGLKRYGYCYNKEKTWFSSMKYQRSVTGLILTDDCKLSIGLQQRNKIKKMIYDKLVKGVGESSSILGYLAYLKSIEPIAYNNLIIKYSKYCSGDIIEQLKAK